MWDTSLDGPLNIDEDKIGGYKRVDNKLVFDQDLFNEYKILKKEQDQKKIDEENKLKNRKDLLKNKTANINDRLNALIEHLGLDV